MTLEDAIAEALSQASDGSPDQPRDRSGLTRREFEIATMVAAGMTNRQISQKLFIAERTAEGHVERIRNKLGFRSRSQIAPGQLRFVSSRRPNASDSRLNHSHKPLPASPDGEVACETRRDELLIALGHRGRLA